MDEKGCIFCKILKRDIPSKRVYDEENFFGILDVNPKADGHALIISKNHYKNILDMPSSMGNELVDAVKKISLDVIGSGKGEGVNIILNTGESAGQVVPHVHAHIIPRKKGDGLKGLA